MVVQGRRNVAGEHESQEELIDSKWIDFNHSFFFLMKENFVKNSGSFYFILFCVK